MSGFFQRLEMRARGATALAGLAVVRPVPALYGGQVSAGPEGSPADSRPAQRAAPSLPRMGDAPEVRGSRTLANTTQAAASAAGRARPEPAPTGIALARTEPAAEQGPKVEMQAPRGRAAVSMPEAGAPDASAAFAVATGETPAPIRREREMPPVAPPRAIGLEHLFETIENGSTAHPSAATVALDWDQGEAPAGAPEPAVISIGQIEISVTPPAAREAPARTHGFEHYARMRRGLER